MLQSDLENLRFRLHRAHLRRDDHLVESILKFLTNDEITQIPPGIRDESRFILAAQGSDVLDQVAVDDISGEKFLAYGSQFSGGTFQSFYDRDPMVLRTDLTDRGFQTRFAIEDDFVQVIVFHAKPVSEQLARGLEFRAHNDSTEIKEDSLYAHLLFVVVFVPGEVFAAAGFFVVAFASAGFAAGFFSLVGLGSGLDSGSGTAAASGAGRGASC